MNLSGKKAGAFIFFGLMLIFFWILQACQQKEATIKIGVAGPMTGDQSKMGIDEKNGADLAVSEWNGRGGVLGRKIELIVADDQHDPKQAVAVANRLVNSGVAGVIGHWNSGSSIPASDVYHQAGIPMITPASTNPDLTERKYENVFRICGRDDQQGKIAADFALSRKSFRKVAILHDKTAYGQGLAQEFQKNLGNRIEIAAFEGITQGEKDFRGILTTLKGKEPDLIFFGGIYPEAAQLARQARELGLKAPMLSGDGTFDQTFIKIAGEAAEGTFLTFSSDPSGKPEVKGVLDRYHSKYGEHGPYSLYAYDAANVLLEALATAKTTEPAALNKSLHQIRLQGTTGQIQFDQKGDLLVSPYVVWVVKGGKFEEVWKP